VLTLKGPPKPAAPTRPLFNEAVIV
jgi:hypothetical protein